jgi:hypothetical protein
MATTWKKGLLLLGLTTAVFATPVMGIEVRHGNRTNPLSYSCDAQSPALSFACSLALDFVRRSTECVSTCAFPALGRKAPRGPPRVHHLVVVEWRWVYRCDSIVRTDCELGSGIIFSHLVFNLELLHVLASCRQLDFQH